MNTTFPILSKLVKNIEPLEYSGAKFKSIEDARKVAKQCQSSKAKLQPLVDLAKTLKVEKAFYTELKGNHILFMIDGDNASIELLPDVHDKLYDAYRPVNREWQWWAMGANLSIMIQCLKNLGSKKIQFNQDLIIGIEREDTIYCLSSHDYGHKNLDKVLPDIPEKIIEKPITKNKETKLRKKAL